MIRMSLLLISTLAFIVSGCATSNPTTMEPIPKAPDYARQLLPGDSALRRVTDPARMPPIAEAFYNQDAFLLDAIDESLIWFAAPSSHQFYPFENFTHEQAVASLRAFQHLLKTSYADVLPDSLLNRRDKMGFPVPLKEWFQGDLRDMFLDIFRSTRAGTRPFVNSGAVLKNFDKGSQFSRKTWGMLSLELWYQTFHDKASDYRKMVDRDADLQERRVI